LIFFLLTPIQETKCDKVKYANKGKRYKKHSHSIIAWINLYPKNGFAETFYLKKYLDSGKYKSYRKTKLIPRGRLLVHTDCAQKEPCTLDPETKLVLQKHIKKFEQKRMLQN